MYFQFLNAVRKAGGTNRLGQLIYKKYGPAKGDYATATKKTAKTFKKMTAAAIKKKAATYQKSKVRGKYFNLKKQVGEANAKKVSAEAKKIRAKSQKKK